ncbi:hypothetical protein [Streptomyces sp. NPDC058667]|uniref:hypothetical protein n=1 Tax=Streptomyces sp. NPDC058667 TaxID=3346588 RepID=UPI0036581098
MSEEFGNSRFERAWETPEEVILRRELIRTPGLQPEDLGVLAELLLRDPWLPSTMEAIRGDLQAQGWKMGKDRYNAISGRLAKAGHLARIPAYDEATQRPTWVTRVYRNPANNEQYVDLGITASMQVNAEVRETRDPEPEPRSGSRETRVSPGQSRNAGNPRSGAGSRETRDPETRVSPGQSRNAENPRSASSPPHPPEEEELLPPTPHVSAGSLPSQREEAVAEFSSEELLDAASFLQEMKSWQAGRKTAQKSAPRLLRAMREQGWPALSAMDEAQRGLLEADVLRNTGGATSWERCLPGWVDDLRRYARVAASPAPAAVAPLPGVPAPADAIVRCGECDAYGWRLDTDPDDPQERCAHTAVSREEGIR